MAEAGEASTSSSADLGTSSNSASAADIRPPDNWPAIPKLKLNVKQLASKSPKILVTKVPSMQGADLEPSRQSTRSKKLSGKGKAAGLDLDRLSVVEENENIENDNGRKRDMDKNAESRQMFQKSLLAHESRKEHLLVHIQHSAKITSQWMIVNYSGTWKNARDENPQAARKYVPYPTVKFYSFAGNKFDENGFKHNDRFKLQITEGKQPVCVFHGAFADLENAMSVKKDNEKKDSIVRELQERVKAFGPEKVKVSAATLSGLSNELATPAIQPKPDGPSTSSEDSVAASTAKDGGSEGSSSSCPDKETQSTKKSLKKAPVSSAREYSDDPVVFLRCARESCGRRDTSLKEPFGNFNSAEEKYVTILDAHGPWFFQEKREGMVPLVPKEKAEGISLSVFIDAGWTRILHQLLNGSIRPSKYLTSLMYRLIGGTRGMIRLVSLYHVNRRSVGDNQYAIGFLERVLGKDFFVAIYMNVSLVISTYNLVGQFKPPNSFPSFLNEKVLEFRSSELTRYQNKLSREKDPIGNPSKTSLKRAFEELDLDDADHFEMFQSFMTRFIEKTRNRGDASSADALESAMLSPPPPKRMRLAGTGDVVLMEDSQRNSESPGGVVPGAEGGDRSAEVAGSFAGPNVASGSEEYQQRMLEIIEKQ